MYEFIVLSLLMRWPMHGYLIAKIINDMIGPYAKISNGRLYPLMAQLERDEFIVANNREARASGRQSHSYGITEKGKQRFFQLIMNTTSNPGDYQRIFWQKVAAFSFLKSSERLYLMDHYINYCQTHILHLQAETSDLTKQGPHWWGEYEVSMTLSVMNHTINQWQLELAWVQTLRKQEEEAAKK